MSEIRRYFDRYTKWDSEKWVWLPYTYSRETSLEEQQKWNDLYQKTRMRKSENTTDNDLKMPDFYSLERDAAQFGLREYTFTDTFGLKWYGKKGAEVEVGAPDYEGHLYYWDSDEDEYPTVSDYDCDKNQPDPKVYYKFKKGYPGFGYEWLDIANIKAVKYHYVVENHLFKDSRINYTYADLEKGYEPTEFAVYDDCMEQFIHALMLFGKTDLVNQLMSEINEHLLKLKNSEREEEREFYPWKTAEELFLSNYVIFKNGEPLREAQYGQTNIYYFNKSLENKPPLETGLDDILVIGGMTLKDAEEALDWLKDVKNNSATADRPFDEMVLEDLDDIEIRYCDKSVWEKPNDEMHIKITDYCYKPRYKSPEDWEAMRIHVRKRQEMEKEGK